MRFCLITFRSVTPAQRGEALLQRNGLECSVRRTPKWMEEQGCGYSIRIHQTDIARGIALLRQVQIPYRKIYLLRDNGSAEELAL